jgi:hypothetical protein
LDSNPELSGLWAGLTKAVEEMFQPMDAGCNGIFFVLDGITNNQEKSAEPLNRMLDLSAKIQANNQGTRLAPLLGLTLDDCWDDCSVVPFIGIRGPEDLPDFAIAKKFHRGPVITVSCATRSVDSNHVFSHLLPPFSPFSFSASHPYLR